MKFAAADGINHKLQTTNIQQQKTIMNTIDNPSAWQLAWILIPIPILCVAVIITRHTPIWFYFIGGASIATYIGAITYLCIKQKCYTQLAATWITTLIWAAIIIL